MFHKYCAVYGSIGIRPLHEEDIETVRQWRNRKELSRFLTPVGEITSKMQKQWFERYQEDEDVIFFAVADLELEKIIGTVALYGFTGTSCEVGKIVIGDDSRRGRGIGYTSLLMAMCTGFAYMGIEKYRLRVCAENETAHSIYIKAGFRETGRHPFLGNMTEINMEITQEEFAEANSMAREIYLYMEGQPVNSKGGG